MDMSPTTQVNMSTVYSVYSCGHTEADSVQSDGPEGPQFVFLEGGCTGSEECATTDPTWFGEQCEIPGPAALSALALLADELQDVRVVVRANLNKFDAMRSISTDTIIELAHLDIVDLFLDEDREEMLEGLFHFSLITKMLKDMRFFAKKSAHRPFFDFCRREARSYVANAINNAEKLHNTVTLLKQHDIPKRTLFTCQWPDSRVYYEPNFGIEELELLRSAGKAGLDLLNQPFDLSMLHEAEVLVEIMKQKSKQETRPSCVTHSDEFGAWLEQEYQAFKAEMAEKTKQKQKQLPQARPTPNKRLINDILSRHLGRSVEEPY